MTKKQSDTLTEGTRVEDNKYGNGAGTVLGIAAGPAGYWSVQFDNGKRLRLGFRNLDLI